ncbi:TetR/AcrR family transcriptional regulator [Mycobacterium sp.]|uniref:TetR/AcrR family transcriptional regulator n=1 Tax=Mycobacterium sp. TaxID=1785 RepID=UPI003BAC769D
MTPARLGRPKGGGLRPEQNAERLVSAAERTFLRLGFDRTTIDDIVAEANVSRSTFYRHFVSRDAILLEVIGRSTDRYLALLATQAEQHSTVQSFIVEAMVSVVTLVRGDPALAAMFNDSGRGAVGRLVGTSEGIKARARTFARRILEQAGPDRSYQLRPGIDIDGAVDHLVLVGLGLIQGFGNRSDDVDALRDYLAEFVVPPLVMPSVGDEPAGDRH